MALMISRGMICISGRISTRSTKLVSFLTPLSGNWIEEIVHVNDMDVGMSIRIRSPTKMDGRAHLWQTCLMDDMVLSRFVLVIQSSFVVPLM